MLAGPDLGSFELDSTLTAPVVVENSSGTPSDPSAAPTFRVYGSAGLLANGTGSLTKFDTTAITNASNATPIVLTAPAHGLQTGCRVNVSGVGGNTAANTETTVTRVDANTVSLDGTAGNGAYTAGGTLHTAGLYQVSLTLAGGNGFVAGQTCWALVSWTLSGVNYGMLCPFRVI